MPNSLAFLMITSWPFVTLVMYLRMKPQSAVIWSILAGYMLLPQGMVLDLPGVPGLDKYSIPPLFGYVFASAMQGRMIPLIPRNPLGRVFVVMMLLAPFLSAATNSDPIFINSERILPGLRPYDAASATVGQLSLLCVWSLSREFLRDAAGLRHLAWALVVAFLWYTLPMLFEVRMSPQLHIMIYGYFQHDFTQMMRQGGFRPIVFLEHGLWIAILTAMAATLAIALARSSPPEQSRRWYRAAVYLLVVLVLCKSVASLIYALLLIGPLMFWSGRRLAQIAVLMAVLVVTYPLLRTLDVVPTDWLVETAQRFSADRAQSLEFRFDNEDALLGHAMERPLFGWGGWGRSFLYDSVTGKVTTVTDGLWVIAMGASGFMGYLGLFGLLSLPIFMMGRAHRAVGREIAVFPAGVAVVLGMNLIDLLPNATITPVTWLFSGALLGYLESLSRAEDEAGQAVIPAAASGGRGRPAYAGLVGGRGLEGPRSLL